MDNESVDVWVRLAAYARATEPGQRGFRLGEKDIHDLLVCDPASLLEADELDRLFPDRHDWT